MPKQKTEYPNHVFCNECDQWENMPIKNNKINHKMKSYACTANNTSFLKPTTLNSSWNKMNITTDEDKERENITTSSQMHIIHIPKNKIVDNVKQKRESAIKNKGVRKCTVLIVGWKIRYSTYAASKRKRTYHPACQKCAL